MPQTFYIESDEEIISVIGRLRKSSAELNYFVVPKRALILQSLVNLRLFQREAQKLGKKIILVTQDEAGQNLAKKVGMQTENYTDDFSEKNGHLELTSAPEQSVGKNNSDYVKIPPMEPLRAMPRSDSIGSAEFNQFGNEAIHPASSAPETSRDKVVSDLRLRVRNNGPAAPLTSLNSTRSDSDLPRIPKPQSLPLRTSPRVPEARPDTQRNTGMLRQGGVAQSSVPPESNERLKKFFSPAPATTPPRVAPAPHARPDKKKTRSIFIVLGGLSLVSLGAVATYLFFPKAEISVTPYKTTRVINTEFEGSTGSFVSGGKSLPVRIIEKEQTVALTVEATGTSANSNQKARGTVTLYNNFGTEPQTLVATTRLESPEGKIFRLVQGVTVPGMKNNEAGSIEAEVLADQSGTAYNIASTTFTIPGFKGSAKFDKFSARSAKAMIGGGDSGGEMKVIAQADIDRVKKEAEEKVKLEFIQATLPDISGEEKLLETALEITPVGDQATIPAGTLASSYDFEGTYRIRAFVIPEATIRKQIEGESTVTVENIRFVPEAVTLSYNDSSPQFNEGRITLKVRALLSLRSDINEEELRERLFGQDEAGIAGILPDFPEVKKIEVRFHPRGLVSTVPNRKERVTIVEKPAEEAGE